MIFLTEGEGYARMFIFINFDSPFVKPVLEYNKMFLDL